MAVQPDFHWQFNERQGSVATDSINGVKAQFVRCSFDLHGRIGNAVLVEGKDSAIYLGKEVGQFGTSDFTIAFGIHIRDTHGQTDMEIIGNRSVSGHGNWVSLLLLNRNQLSFEVDEDRNGKNFFTVRTGTVLTSTRWCHVALVREGRTLRIYVDGVLQVEGELDKGIANINDSVDMKVGDWLRDTPTARYEDLRIYHKALNAEQIQNLIPPLNRLLHPRQIELIDTFGAAVMLTQDEEDLFRYSPKFQKLRLGPDTGATLYKGAAFGDVFQKLYADVPELNFTNLAAPPGQSISGHPLANPSPVSGSSPRRMVRT